MLTVTKEFNFALSHLLDNHKGLCRNVHGHNYKLYVTFQRTHDEVIEIEDSSKGMVIDFKDLKQLVNKKIVDNFDHAFVYDSTNETSVQIANFLIKLINQKTLGLPFRTTAENMSKYICNKLNDLLKKKYYDLGVRIKKVKLYETDTSFSEYYNEN